MNYTEYMMRSLTILPEELERYKSIEKAMDGINIVRRDNMVVLEVFGMSIALPRDVHKKALEWQKLKT
jgi:hypothetical protein